MSMTGGISFFEDTIAKISNGSTITASSNQNDARYVLSNNRYYRWVSVNSDDATVETITITLPLAQEISRLFLIGHNFKDFSVQYDVNSDFTNVSGVDGALTGIDESACPRDTTYYEFDPVITDTIIIKAAKTQIADAQKFLEWVVLTNEIGTFNKYPNVDGFKIDPNETKQKDAAGGQRIIKNRETVSLQIDMAHYPDQDDIKLLSLLRKRFDPCLVWMNGGKPSQFRHELEGWRLRDLYLMQSAGAMRLGYYKNIYTCAQDQKLNFEEVSR